MYLYGLYNITCPDVPWRKYVVWSMCVHTFVQIFIRGGGRGERRSCITLVGFCSVLFFCVLYFFLLDFFKEFFPLCLFGGGGGSVIGFSFSFIGSSLGYVILTNGIITGNIRSLFVCLQVLLFVHWHFCSRLFPLAQFFQPFVWSARCVILDSGI